MILFKKIISISVILSFLNLCLFDSNPTVYAGTPSVIADSNMSLRAEQGEAKQSQAVRNDNLNIPHKLGTVEEIFFPDTSDQQLATKQVVSIVLVQDAHSNYESQKSIAGLIEYVDSTHQPQAVLMEGVFGEIDTSLLQAVPSGNLRKEGLVRLMKKGLISGPEYFQASASASLPLKGIENKNDYLDNYKAFLEVQSMREKVSREVKLIETRLMNIQKKIYPKELRELDRVRERFTKGQMNLWDYLERLMSFSPQAIEWKRYPQLGMLVEFQKEDEKSKQELQTLQSQLDGRAIFNELYELEKEIRATYLTQHNQILLDQHLSQLRLFKQGLALELVPQAVELFRQEENQLAFDSVREFVDQESRKKQWPTKSDLNEAREKILQFYEWAEKRDKSLYQNIVKSMEEAAGPVVVIAGGYHTKGLGHLFREENHSKWIIIFGSHSELGKDSLQQGYKQIQGWTALLSWWVVYLNSPQQSAPACGKQITGNPHVIARSAATKQSRDCHAPLGLAMTIAEV